MVRLRKARLALATAVLLAASAATAGTGPAPGAPAPKGPPAGAAAHVVRVYYFRTNTRCTSCRKIEAFTDAAVKKAFGREMKDHALVWQVINVQEPPNAHFIQEYQLAAKSVVVVDMVGGEQVRWKNLAKIWELLDDEQAFARYVQDEVRRYLEGRS